MAKLTERYLRNHEEYEGEERIYYSSGYYNAIGLGGLIFNAIHEKGESVEIQVEVCGLDVVISTREDFDKFLEIMQKGL